MIYQVIVIIVVMIGLYTLSKGKRKTQNGFTRNFSQVKPTLSKSFSLGFNSYYIAGIDDYDIYLGNVTAPLLVLKMNQELSDTISLQVKLPSKYKNRLKDPLIRVDENDLYLFDGSAPLILRGCLSDWKVNEVLDSVHYFNDFVSTSDTTFIIRHIGQSHQYMLSLGRRNSLVTTPIPNRLERQIDGLFCNEGKLHYSKESNQVLYLYRYRNQFTCMDDRLTIVSRGRTIDTTTTARIRVGKITSENAVQLIGSQATVNKQSYLCGNFLFVNSSLNSDNEEWAIFNRSSVFDIYDIHENKYLCSFYIPDFKTLKVRSFIFFNGKLFAIHDRYLVIYEFDLKGSVLASNEITDLQ